MRKNLVVMPAEAGIQGGVVGVKETRTGFPLARE